MERSGGTDASTTALVTHVQSEAIALPALHCIIGHVLMNSSAFSMHKMMRASVIAPSVLDDAW